MKNIKEHVDTPLHPIPSHPIRTLGASLLVVYMLNRWAPKGNCRDIVLFQLVIASMFFKIQPCTRVSKANF